MEREKQRRATCLPFLGVFLISAFIFESICMVVLSSSCREKAKKEIQKPKGKNKKQKARGKMF
jgi:hypothetical protein